MMILFHSLSRSFAFYKDHLDHHVLLFHLLIYKYAIKKKEFREK